MKLLFIQKNGSETDSCSTPKYLQQILLIHALRCLFLAHSHFSFFRALSDAQEATSACWHSVTM